MRKKFTHLQEGLSGTIGVLNIGQTHQKISLTSSVGVLGVERARDEALVEEIDDDRVAMVSADLRREFPGDFSFPRLGASLPKPYIIRKL